MHLKYYAKYLNAFEYMAQPRGHGVLSRAGSRDRDGALRLDERAHNTDTCASETPSRIGEPDRDRSVTLKLALHQVGLGCVGLTRTSTSSSKSLRRGRASARARRIRRRRCKHHDGMMMPTWSTVSKVDDHSIAVDHVSLSDARPCHGVVTLTAN
eukprot:3940794-Rhodomonas_salina.1